MTGNASEAPSSLRIARRVLDREVVPSAGATPADVAAALQRVCARLSYNLRDSMGPAGYDALLVRALARAEPAHPALVAACPRNGGEIHLDNLQASIEKHGVVAATAAVEALLAAFIDLLSRLIGEDMAIRLMDQDVPRSRPGGGARLP
jgi:hypothetical protein